METQGGGLEREGWSGKLTGLRSRLLLLLLLLLISHRPVIPTTVPGTLGQCTVVMDMHPAQSLFGRARSSTAVVLVTTTAVGAVAGAAAASTTATAAVASTTGDTEDSAAEDMATAGASEHAEQRLSPTDRSVTGRQSSYLFALQALFAHPPFTSSLRKRSPSRPLRASLSPMPTEQAFVCRYPQTACSSSTLYPLPRASLIFVA